MHPGRGENKRSDASGNRGVIRPERQEIRVKE
jgi:hypothetical protein